MGFLKAIEISTGWNFETTGCFTLVVFEKLDFAVKSIQPIVSTNQSIAFPENLNKILLSGFNMF